MTFDLLVDTNFRLFLIRNHRRWQGTIHLLIYQAPRWQLVFGCICTSGQEEGGEFLDVLVHLHRYIIFLFLDINEELCRFAAAIKMYN